MNIENTNSENTNSENTNSENTNSENTNSENTQVVIRKNGVDLTILTDSLALAFKRTVQGINEKMAEPVEEEKLFQKNKKIPFDPTVIITFLHSIVYDLITEQRKIIESKKDNVNLTAAVNYYSGLFYDLSILENLLLSFLYSDKKNKKNEWTYSIETQTVSFQEVLDVFYLGEKKDDIEK